MNNNYNIEIIDTQEKFSALRGEWNALLSNSHSDTVFLTWEWLYTWWSIFGKNNQLYILLCKNNEGNIEGIAPLYLKRNRILQLFSVSELKILGSGTEVASEYLDFICIKGKENLIMDTFLEFLNNESKKWDTLNITDLADSSLSIPLLIEAFVNKDMSYLKYEKRPFCPIVRLPSSWYEYLKSLPKQMRTNIKGGRKKIEKDFANNIVVEGKNGNLVSKADFDRFIHLYSQRREQKKDKNRFNEKDYNRFQLMVYDLFNKKNWLYLYLLNFSGKDVAAQYGFHYKDTYYFFQSGMNPNFAKYGVGQILISYILENAIRDGLKIYDMLRGEEWYKMRWANEVRKKYSIFASKKIRGRILIQYLKMQKTSSKIIKSLLPVVLKKKIQAESY